MSERHITRDEAAQWVSGLMEGAEATELERHVETCPPCEGLVQTEARVELALGRAAAASAEAASNVVVPLRRKPVVIAVAVAVALAASLVLVLRPKPPPKSDPMQEPAPFTVIEIEGEAADEVEGVMHVPRYEDGHELPALALTANEPFPL